MISEGVRWVIAGLAFIALATWALWPQPGDRR